MPNWMQSSFGKVFLINVLQTHPMLPNADPFAAEQSRGTKSPYWRGNEAMGHVEQRKFKFGGFL